MPLPCPRVALRIRLALPRRPPARPEARVSPSRSRRRRRLRVGDSTKVTQQSQRPSSAPRPPGPSPRFPQRPERARVSGTGELWRPTSAFSKGAARAQFTLRRRTRVAGNAPGSEGFPDPPPPTPRGPAGRGGPGSAPPPESAAAAPSSRAPGPSPAPRPHPARGRNRRPRGLRALAEQRWRRARLRPGLARAGRGGASSLRPSRAGAGGPQGRLTQWPPPLGQ